MVALSATDAVIGILAVWQIVEIWRHGSIFAEARLRLELHTGFIPDLLRCGFCLPPWVAWSIVSPPLLSRNITVQQVPAWAAWAFTVMDLWYYVVCCFALARGANIGNDLMYSMCRTPGRKKKDRGDGNEHAGADGSNGDAGDVRRENSE